MRIRPTLRAMGSPLWRVRAAYVTRPGLVGRGNLRSGVPLGWLLPAIAGGGPLSVALIGIVIEPLLLRPVSNNRRAEEIPAASFTFGLLQILEDLMRLVLGAERRYRLITLIDALPIPWAASAACFLPPPTTSWVIGIGIVAAVILWAAIYHNQVWRDATREHPRTDGWPQRSVSMSGLVYCRGPSASACLHGGPRRGRSWSRPRRPVLGPWGVEWPWSLRLSSSSSGGARPVSRGPLVGGGVVVSLCADRRHPVLSGARTGPCSYLIAALVVAGCGPTGLFGNRVMTADARPPPEPLAASRLVARGPLPVLIPC